MCYRLKNQYATNVQPIMTSFTIKNIPDALVKKLRESSTINHRSMNAEVIFLLKQALESPPRQVLTLEKIRSLRAKTESCYLTQERLDELKQQGRS